jgi:hypothetical protein
MDSVSVERSFPLGLIVPTCSTLPLPGTAMYSLPTLSTATLAGPLLPRSGLDAVLKRAAGARARYCGARSENTPPPASARFSSANPPKSALRYHTRGISATHDNFTAESTMESTLAIIEVP